MREELPREPRWTYSGTKLETADTAKESLQLLGLLYSESKSPRRCQPRHSAVTSQGGYAADDYPFFTNFKAAEFMQ